jgi:glycosyltransferase involved in cell wall biosynthesis
LAPPRITIITPVLNRAATIGEALNSVALQGYPEVEHLVIDGGSTDGTLERLKHTPGIELVHEPDRGLFEALNIGIRRATGDVIGHLDSTDVLLPGALAAVADGFMSDRTAEGVCGGAQVVRVQSDGTSRLVKTYRGERLKRLDWHGATLGMPLTNARFFRRSWYRRAGLYDNHYPLAADRDFLIRSLILGIRTTPLQRILYQYRLPAVAATGPAVDRQRRRMHEESKALARTWMIRADSPEPLRRVARRWFAVETAHQLGHLAAKRAWPEFRAAFWDARDFLPGWPLSLLREGMHRLSGGLW